MVNFQSAILNLTSAVNSSPDTMMQHIKDIVDSSAYVSVDEKNEGLKKLIPLIELEQHPVISATIGIVCGALVEGGANPLTLFDPLFKKLEDFVPKAKTFIEACETEGALEADDQNTAMNAVAQNMPEESLCFAALDRIYLPIIAISSRSEEARRQFRSQLSSIDDLDWLAQVSTGAHWLVKLWHVLDEEILIVLHPETKRGYQVKISGIADNFQLLVLLQNAVIGDEAQGYLSGIKPPENVVAVMRDQSPTQNLTAFGTLNMVNYTGLASDGTLPPANEISAHWIWGEGIPADILPLEGTRIILLQKPPYQRSWNAQRLFDGMVGELEVIEQLTAEQVQSWLERIAIVNSAS